jgi:transposase
MDRDLRRRRMDRRILELLLAGKTQRQVIKELDVGDRRIRRVQSLALAHGYLDGTRALPPFPEALFPEPEPKNGKVSDVDLILLEQKEWIQDRLKLGWSSVTVWEELPMRVGRSSFYRFLDRHCLDRLSEKRRIIPEIIHKPGEALLLDWGKLRSVKDPETGKSKTLWAFVGVLGFSRYMMVRLVWTNDVATTLTAIESMLKEIGGVPARITSDNPKCFAIEASKYEPLLNPVFERWAHHHGITIECLPPADPEKKGKVERLMPYTRRLYEAHGLGWLGVEESQNYINRKLEIANQRKHGTTNLKPVDVFKNIEMQALKALPALNYEMEEFHQGSVRKDGFVRFRNKYYCVGEDYIGKEVVVLGNKLQVSIYFKGKLLEVHDRITDPHKSKAIKPHQLKPHERVIQDGAFYIKRAEQIGPFTSQLITLILAQGHGFVDTRKVWGILSLDKKFEKLKIENACKIAYEMNSPSYRTVASLVGLTTSTSQEDKSPQQNKDEEKINKFIRPLAEYGQLILFNHPTGGKTNEPPDSTRPVKSP